MAKKNNGKKRESGALTRQQRIVVLVLIILIIAVVVIGGILLAVKGVVGSSSTSFTPPEEEENAVEGVPEVDEDLGWSEITVDDGYIVSVCGVVNEEDGSAEVWFYSDEENEVWVKLRIQDEDGNTIGESGLLMPGEYVQYVELDTVPEEDETVYLEVMGYEPDTYYSAGSVTLETTLYADDD